MGRRWWVVAVAVIAGVVALVCPRTADHAAQASSPAPPSAASTPARPLHVPPRHPPRTSRRRWRGRSGPRPTSTTLSGVTTTLVAALTDQVG
ncbi:hypothetical protein ACQPYE_07615 [Actinosynnema sp. CA-299493]